MSLKYIKIRKSPIIFNRLFGVSVNQFEEILLKIEPQWQKQVVYYSKTQFVFAFERVEIFGPQICKNHTGQASPKLTTRGGQKIKRKNILNFTKLTKS